MISKINSTVFKGLYYLMILNLYKNELSVLSSDVFSDLHELVHLNIYFNPLHDVPSQTLASLHSIQYLYMTYLGSTLDTVISKFHNLTRLTDFDMLFPGNVTNSTFHSLTGLTLQKIGCGLTPKWKDCYFDKSAFASFTSVRELLTHFRAIPALGSIRSPLQSLALVSWLKFPSILHNTTFQELWKFQEFLTGLCLFLSAVCRIENDSFMWTPNLSKLVCMSRIETLAKYSFRGLNSLKMLDLRNNKLTAVPYEALNIIGKFQSLLYLDLRSNSISTLAIENNTFTGLTSLNYLNLENNYLQGYAGYINTLWLNSLQKHNYLIINFASNNFGVSIDLPFPLLSLSILEIRNIGLVTFKSNLCHSFPNLRSVVISNILISEIGFLPHLALHKCQFLTKLDLSDSTINVPYLEHTNISIPNLEDLTLAKNKLTSIWQTLFIKATNLTSLNVSDNEIKTIDSTIGHAFKYLIHLFIDGNDLASLSGLQHLTFLKYLNAARNQITEVPQWLLSTKNAPILIKLDLSDNPFSCTCKIEKFRKWIVTDTNTWLQPGQYNCGYPEDLAGITISAIELDCRSFTAFYIGVSIPFVILFCALIIFLFRYRWHIKYKLFLLYRNYRPFPEINEEFEMLQLQYHAYIAYNEHSEDDEWVMNELQPNLEQGPEPVRLCIKSRDFIPGHSLIKSISENIQQSRNTILVLSPSFVESEWCYHEMEMAKMKLLDENLDVIVLVLLNEIPNNAMTLSLRQLLCKKEYLKWPKDRAGQRLFWQRLRQELKAPVQIDRRFCM